MMVQLKTREQVKADFYRKGITVKDWAERHGFNRVLKIEPQWEIAFETQPMPRDLHKR